MDAESDDSERWEDFYGSSTELAPALLSIYDALNTSFETQHNQNSKNEERSCKSQNIVFKNSITHAEENMNTLKKDKNLYNSPKSACLSLQQSPTVNKSSCRNRQIEPMLNTKQRNNIKLLSPNVQRIIAHSDAQHVDSINIEALQQQPVDNAPPCNSTTTVSPQHYRKKPNACSISGHAHKGKLSLIPLSKGAEKLTMSGNDLVETFDSSCEYLDTLVFAQNQTVLSAHKHILTSDDEKTPTNTNKPFNFDLSQSKERKDNCSDTSLPSIDLMEMKKLATTTQLLSTLSMSPTNSTTQELAVTLVKKNVNVEKTSFKEINGSQKEIEAINTTLVNKILFNTNKTISRSQSLAHPRALNKDLAMRQTASLKSSTSKSFPALEEHENGSTESLDRLTEMKSKFSTKEPQKMSSLLLPEISKLKHRPLSSSSLCSTTSSSSSGSDNLNSKLSTSYLASVESLADHSESELTDQHANMSVLDRSCLEIVDSERNYVEDLRQVITGYLSDWKERACLRVDELKVLFSNIEEIYEFSSVLLKHLMESTMDPVKIAKCFINMREGFGVYTKYCTSYPEAISLLTKLLQATHTNALLTSTQKMLQHTLPLGSYLLKPVQRILKYHLLLDNLRKHCDVKEVFQAFEIMRQVARNIDQVKRRLEQQSRVKELSGILDGWLGPELTVLGELRLEGLLMDHNKPRMVFLFATMLIITKPKEDSRLQFKSYIHQNNLMLSEHLPGEPTSFYVIPYDEPRNQIKLTAKNRDQKRVWTQHLKEAMLEKFDNIPSRAKELVYKLGDEEDRTSEKNTWKWTMNSTSVTPVYLERRNQYRRSELRNRFKLKRKSIADLSFTQSSSPKEQLPEDECSKPTKPLTRKNSLDDSMVPMLFRFATVVRHKCLQPTSNEEHQKTGTNHKIADHFCSDHLNTSGEQCSCILTDQRSKNRDGPKLKERSKSVPRINIQTEENDEEKLTAIEHNLMPAKSMEIKQYNHKTMPKRVATIKKQRSSNKRDTFKFYMDISEFDKVEEATVLKITESTENLNISKEIEVEKEVMDSDHSKNETNKTEISKKDAQIVFDLLKDNKEFERIYKKPQRKRSGEVNGQRQTNNRENTDDPPPLPTSSPPLLEMEATIEKLIQAKTKDNNEEHIYETLLRNVHVPYKFSPDFKRSKSLQYNSQHEKTSLPPRPDSDYVILKYTKDGTLERVESSSEDNNNIDENSQKQQLKTPENQSIPLAKSIERPQLMITSAIETSQPDVSPNDESKNMLSSSNSVNTPKEQDLPYADQKPKGLVKRLFIAKNGYKISSLENISNAFMTRSSRRKSAENNARLNGSSSKPPERRASDVSEMCRLAMLHRQGSEAVGERMAYLDYADPRTLFNKQLQRDSFFSLTSSNDSVYGQNSRTAKNSSTELSTNFEYEDDVEHNLERDFRDSAIYSDDNEKRAEYEIERDKETNKQISPERNRPPKLPPKPPRLKMLATTHPHTHPAVIVCPPHMNQTASRSWVLQQIENFSK